jgi:hypothetical protein
MQVALSNAHLCKHMLLRQIYIPYLPIRGPGEEALGHHRSLEQTVWRQRHASAKAGLILVSVQHTEGRRAAAWRGRFCCRQPRVPQT